MASISSQLVVRLIDGVTGPAKKAAASLRGLAATARTSTMATARSVNRIAGGVTAGFGGLGLYKAHQQVLDFATAANKLAAANPDFKMEQIREVSKLAREVSRQTLFNPATVLDAANSLARADVNLDAIKGTLKPLATAAMAADVPVNDLADSFVKLASNFGMSLKSREDASKTFTYLGDLATYVGQKAPGSFGDYVAAMVKVGAAARTAGIDIRWLSGAYIMLDKAGIRNEEAGTALRSMIKSMVQPTLAARKMYAQLGIDPSTFLKGGKKVTAEQMVAGFQSEYGKDLAKAAPRIQQVIESNLSSKDKSTALFNIVRKMWGGKMRPVDARKVKKSVDDFMFSATEKIDPQAWMDELRKKGVTLGQFLRLVEPRQASRLINLLHQDLGDAEADKRLNQPLAELPGFREGLAAEAGAKMMQGYPAAVKKISDAFQSLIESLDNAGVIDAFASALRSVGESVTAISQGTAGFREWSIALAAATPFLAGLTPIIAGIVAAVGFLVATPVGIAVALAAIVAAVVMFWPQIKEGFAKLSTSISEAFGDIDLFDAGARIMSSLWDGLKSTFNSALDFLGGIGGKIKDAVAGALPDLGIGPKTYTPGKGERPPRQATESMDREAKPVERGPDVDQPVVSVEPREPAKPRTRLIYPRMTMGWDGPAIGGEEPEQQPRPQRQTVQPEPQQQPLAQPAPAPTPALEAVAPSSIQNLDQSQAAGDAGSKTGSAFKQNMQAELEEVDAMIRAKVQTWAGMLSFSASPSITPKLGAPGPAPAADPRKQHSSANSLTHARHAAFADGVNFGSFG